MSLATSTPAALRRMSSFPMSPSARASLRDGTKVNISPDELSEMKRAFELFDHDRSGSFNATELQALHTRLGEPLTDAEAVSAIESMTSPGQTSVSFEEFVKYWDREHFDSDFGSDPERKNAARYRARFKFVKARIHNPEVGKFYTQEEGEFPSLAYRVRFFYGDMAVPVSPWHNVPHKNRDGSFNFICEIPKWTRRKFEIATGEPFNAIKQDTHNGKLREYAWGDMMFNYGALPQTWESPEVVTPGTGKMGDNDPLDAIEIGNKQWSTGAIVSVKVLGVFALIDSDETDWKLITISTEDPMADKLNDVEDVEAHLPGLIPCLREWLRLYKSPGGVINEFGFDGKCMNRDFAEGIVAETHHMWKALIKEKGTAALV